MEPCEEFGPENSVVLCCYNNPTNEEYGLRVTQYAMAKDR